MLSIDISGQNDIPLVGYLDSNRWINPMKSQVLLLKNLKKTSPTSIPYFCPMTLSYLSLTNSHRPIHWRRTNLYLQQERTSSRCPVVSTRWCPPVISWFINPINYRYNSLINPNVIVLINQLNAIPNWGTTLYRSCCEKITKNCREIPCGWLRNPAACWWQLAHHMG